MAYEKLSDELRAYYEEGDHLLLGQATACVALERALDATRPLRDAAVAYEQDKNKTDGLCRAACAFANAASAGGAGAAVDLSTKEAHRLMARALSLVRTAPQDLEAFPGNKQYRALMGDLQGALAQPVDLSTKEPATLECDHCGDVAATESIDGFFLDGQGEKCESCGFPGTVSCDAETDPYWSRSDADNARCQRSSCRECWLERTGWPTEPAQKETPTKCPRCESPDPKRHPAMQFEGEVQICEHAFHVGLSTPAQKDVPQEDGQCDAIHESSNQRCTFRVGHDRHHMVPAMRGWHVWVNEPFERAARKETERLRSEVEALHRERSAHLALLSEIQTDARNYLVATRADGAEAFAAIVMQAPGDVRPVLRFWKDEVEALRKERDDQAKLYAGARSDWNACVKRAESIRDERDAIDAHVVEVQKFLHKEGAQTGADGSIVVGIGRLVEQRDELRSERDAARVSREHSHDAWHKEVKRANALEAMLSAERVSRIDCERERDAASARAEKAEARSAKYADQSSFADLTATNLEDRCKATEAREKKLLGVLRSASKWLAIGDSAVARHEIDAALSEPATGAKKEPPSRVSSGPGACHCKDGGAWRYDSGLCSNCAGELPDAATELADLRGRVATAVRYLESASPNAVAIHNAVVLLRGDAKEGK